VTVTRRTLFLIVLVVLALATLVPTINTYVAQQQQLHALQDQVSGQEAEIEDLQAQVRERLLFAMPGETQYRLMDASGADVPLTAAEQESLEKAQEADWFTALWDGVEGADRAQDVDSAIPPADGSSSDDDSTSPDTDQDTE
jgi:type II secretory pathway pseudopilin PulG